MKSFSTRARPALLAAVAMVAMTVAAAAMGALPAGFTEQSINRPDGQSWNEAVGLTFSPTGRLFVWERTGRVWVVDAANPLTSRFLDIRDEVAAYSDHGLLGFALHPNFNLNGYVYLLYTVERHHLLNCDSPAAGVPACGSGYVAGTHIRDVATIARVTRFRATRPAGDADYSRANGIDPASRRVLMGESYWQSDPSGSNPARPRNNSCPMLHLSHGVGSLVFGQDGSLLVSCGDGGTPNVVDAGPGAETYSAQALADGIIRPEENVGAFRSLMVNSYSGKLLRIDADTGDALPSNPFYDPQQPRSARSRTWALGLRNPYRFTLRPGSGSHEPDAGNPGVFYLGDVGWNNWEELDVVQSGAQNFGWPLFEGLEAQSEYNSPDVENRDAPNPLYNGTSCTRRYFRFRELIRQDSLAAPSWPNPCNNSQQISSTDVFMHQRPVLDWHSSQAISRFPAFSGNSAVAVPLGNTAPDGTRVTGSQFSGNTSTGGVWYTAGDFPAQYANTYFHGDYGGQWIRNFVFDQNNVLREVRNFGTGLGGVVSIATHPVDGGLYYIAWTAFVRKISYAPTTNVPPVAVAIANRQHGASPLAVNFNGSQSSDANGGALTYSWNFGDGSPSASGPVVAHTYTSATIATYTATLTVTDSGGLQGSSSVLVSVNNSPPAAQITSPADGSVYSILAPSDLDLAASLSDAETGPGSLACSWVTVLHHNDHTHQDPPDNRCAASARIEPLGCGSETYFYELRLTVTDPQGLQQQTASRIYPDCPAQDVSPPTAPAGLAAVAAGYDRVNLSWLASGDNTGVAGYQVERCQSAGCSNFVQVGTATTTSFVSTGLSGSTAYSYRVRAVDAAGNLSTYSGIATATTLSPPGLWIRVNVGGPAYTDVDGNLWAADSGFNTGSILNWPAATLIAGTANASLYRSERWDAPAAPVMSYSTAVPAGTYQVRLHFAENNPSLFAAGRRVFAVQAEGLTVIPALDVYAEAGPNTALVRAFSVPVADGALNISFLHGVEDPFVNAIEIISQGAGDTTPPSAPGSLNVLSASESQVDLAWSPATDAGGISAYQVERCQNAGCTGFVLLATVPGTSYSDAGLSPATTYRYRVRAVDAAANAGAYSPVASAITATPAIHIRVNVGGPGHTDGQGNSWASDTGFNAGNILAWPAGTPVAGTADADLYRSERWDGPSLPVMSYGASLPAGTYQVRLHFAENNPSLFAPGQRVFAVQAEGQTVIPALDVYALAGPNTALVQTFSVVVSDGALNISFLHGVEDPFVNAIEIIAQASSDITPPTAPGGLTASTPGPAQVQLNWAASADAVGVTGYRVERCQGAACQNFAEIAVVPGNATTYTNTGLAEVTTYRYRLRAEDLAGNRSNYSGIITVTTRDTTPPTAPGKLMDNLVTNTSVGLGWLAAIDNAGVAAYAVESCRGTNCTAFAFKAFTEHPATALQIAGLQASTVYRFRVRAIDASSNTGPYSMIHTVKTRKTAATGPCLNCHSR